MYMPLRVRETRCTSLDGFGREIYTKTNIGSYTGLQRVLRQAVKLKRKYAEKSLA